MNKSKDKLNCYLYYKYGITPSVKTENLKTVLNTTTTNDILESFLDSEDELILCVIAKHPNASSETLEKLVDNLEKDNLWIFLSVCENINTNARTLERLTTIKGCYRSIAMNKNCSVNALDTLASVIPDVVVKNHNTSTETLELIYSSNTANNILSSIAGHPNVSEYLLNLLSESDDAHVRSSVLWNKKVTTQILERLSEDPVSWISNNAKNKLQIAL